MADTLLNKPGVNYKRRVFFARESTFNTMVKPATTDAAKIRSGMINTHKPNRIDVEENRSSRSTESRYTANTPPTPWEFEFDLRPSGVAGTPPDIHPLLLAAISGEAAASGNGGGYTNTPGVSDAYALTDALCLLGSVSIHDFLEAGDNTAKHGHQLETLSGATCEEMTISGNGTEAPKIRFSGTGAQYAFTGRDDLDDAAPGGQTTVDVTNVQKFRQNSIIAFYEEADGTTLVDDNTGAGFAVTSISGSTLSLDGTTDVGVADNDIVVPWAPVETIAGDPLDPSLGSFTFDGVSVLPIEYSFTIKNNIKMYDNEAFTRYASGFHENFREVTGRFTYRLKTGDLTGVLMQRDDFTAVTITMVMGDTNGKRVTLVFKGEIDFDNFDRSQDETVIATVPLRGIVSSRNAKDELTLTYS